MREEGLSARERLGELLAELAALRERAARLCQETEALCQIYRETLHGLARYVDLPPQRDGIVGVRIGEAPDAPAFDVTGADQPQQILP